MKIAVLVKQIPAPVEFRMHEGRLVRDGVPLEVNAYCRRANAKAVELAGAGGEVVVFTMGPPAAADALREMIACGAHRGVHLCDPAFAGSDTLATAVALAAAIRREGPFDLVLAGLNSLDSDTGQVPVEVAELLDLPFAAGVRDLEVDGRAFTARLETDDGYHTVTGDLPVALSAAERLTAPSKAPPEVYAEVADDRILRLAAADLDVPVEQLGASGSPTSVGPVRVLTATRRALRAASVAEAVDMLEEFGAFVDPPESDDAAADASPASAALLEAGTDGAHAQVGERSVWCFFTEPPVGAELLGEAAELAAWISGTVTAVTTIADAAERAGLGAAGADRLLLIECGGRALRAGRRAGGRRGQAAAVGAAGGGDPLGPGGRLHRGRPLRLGAHRRRRRARGQAPAAVWWRGNPRSAAASRCRSCRARRCRWPRSAPGSWPCGRPAPMPAELEAELLPAPPPARIRTVAVERDDDDSGELRRARTVVAVGVGVDPDGYPVIDELRAALGDAALGATRRVTDQGWVPRGRQIGVTGHAVSPRLLVAVGSSGRFNHTVGIRNAGVLMAVNSDPEAEIFDQVDIGLVGEWQTIVPELTAELNRRGIGDWLRSSEAPTGGTATARRGMRVSDLRASRAKPVRASGYP